MPEGDSDAGLSDRNTRILDSPFEGDFSECIKYKIGLCVSLKISHNNHRPHFLSSFCLTGLIFLWPSFALSADVSPETEMSVSVGVSFLDFRYAEYDVDGGLLDYENGFLPGLTLEATRTENDWFVTGKLDYHAGDVLYDGQTQTGVAVVTRSDAIILDVFFKFGRHFYVEGRPSYSLYGGVGHHYWHRAIRSIGAVSGLTEIYRWDYAALGLNHVLDEGDHHTWKIDLRIQRTLSPSMEFNTVQFPLAERNGTRIAFPWSRPLQKKQRLNIEPYYERWELGRSPNREVILGGKTVSAFEPDSVTNNRGVIVSFTGAL
ncbi:MAG: hypothetical protein AAB134_03555 [Pseudomonadota bacterium]